MKRHEGETMSSFNRRFASFYYNMSKEIQPLEGVPKLHYASIFPPELSLLLLGRISITLHHMFIDSLEVEENIRMSKKNSNVDNNNKMERELELNEKYEQKEPPLPYISILYEQEDDPINDVQEKGYNNLFYENYNHPVINSVSNDYKEVFRLLVHDEYEDDYLELVPKNQ